MEKLLICWFKDKRGEELDLVGGKNSSLSKMIRGLSDRGVRVPNGFATTSNAYLKFLQHNKLDAEIAAALQQYRVGKKSLNVTGSRIRKLIQSGEMPPAFEKQLKDSFMELKKLSRSKHFSVAVRSSATAEDLPGASFAGQLESFLNIATCEQVVESCKRCFASLFTDRAIVYREDKKLSDVNVAVSVGIQEMARSDKACAGVMFSLDTDTGFPRVVVINSSWGLGESVVQGAVNPDEFIAFKPHLSSPKINPVIEKTLGTKEKKVVYAGKDKTKIINTTKAERRAFTLSDEEVRQLGLWALEVENFYGRPMDMEWAKDGEDGKLYLVQARPETVYAGTMDKPFQHFTLQEKGEKLIIGSAIGTKIACGKARILSGPEEIGKLKEGDVLIAPKTDPDWVPAMKKAAAIVTEQGGRTSHAAIVSRELGLAAVIGAEGASHKIKDGDDVTVCCAEGEVGVVYKGRLKFSEQTVSPEKLPKTHTNIMINVASPGAAFRWWRLPTSGIGLARIEFIISNAIQIHPMALVHPERIHGADKRKIAKIVAGYPDKTTFFVNQLAMGIAKIAASQFPNPAIVRFSDFKTNEYAGLLGGKAFEPVEANPMLGFRGASRYYDDRYREGFALECRAMKKAREEFGMHNIIPMIPFCRTPEEADRVLEEMGKNGLRRGEHALQVYVMAEIPSNILAAADFAERFDGFSIGSNDLTQLMLGVDRDSAILKRLFDERHPVVKKAISMLIREAHAHSKKVGICGQAPSDYPEFSDFLVDQGIDSISLNPDSVIEVIQRVHKKESRKENAA
jgi:pyruvate,water dikinase